jgi:hypothetical protein
VANWLKSLLGVPQASGPEEVVRRFRTSDPTLSQDGVTADGDSWVVDSREGRTVRLFEVEVPQVEQCVLTYRASLRSEDLAGRGYLEMWCRVPGRGEFFSKGLGQPIKGTTGWGSYETPFYLKRDQRADLIKLNLVAEGPGRVWIKDIELLKTPLG